MAGIVNLFSSNLDFVTLITSKPLIRYTKCSTYCIAVLIPRLHQFFRKFGKISGSWRLSLFLFRQIRTLSPPITSKLLIRYIQYSTYCMIVVLIPRLHQFCRQKDKIAPSQPKAASLCLIILLDNYIYKLII